MNKKTFKCKAIRYCCGYSPDLRVKLPYGASDVIKEFLRANLGSIYGMRVLSAKLFPDRYPPLDVEQIITRDAIAIASGEILPD